MSDDWMRDRIGAAQREENPLVIARMRSGYAVIGDYQFMPGYCVLLASPRSTTSAICRCRSARRFWRI